jgi:hypothetical protein
MTYQTYKLVPHSTIQYNNNSILVNHFSDKHQRLATALLDMHCWGKCINIPSDPYDPNIIGQIITNNFITFNGEVSTKCPIFVIVL